MEHFLTLAKAKRKRGQATLEAAFVIPLAFFLLALLVQPAVILYDKMVMTGAACEGCRLLATKTDVASGPFVDAKYEDAILHRLAAIPPIALFHIHGDTCSYEIEMTGDENDAEVTVTVRNRIKLIPGVSLFAQIAGFADDNGEYILEVTQTAPALPSGIDSDELFDCTWND